MEKTAGESVADTLGVFEGTGVTVTVLELIGSGVAGVALAPRLPIPVMDATGTAVEAVAVGVKKGVIVARSGRKMTIPLKIGIVSLRQLALRSSAALIW